MYAAEAAVGADQIAAGLLLQNEGLAAAEAAQDPTRLAEAHWAKSRILLFLDRTGEARLEAEAAAAFADEADIGQPRRKVLADVALTRAQVLAKEEPQAALEYFADAMDSFKALQARPAIAYASLLQSRHLKSMHRLAEAERDLRVAIEILDDPTAQALDSDLQVSFTETLQSIYDEWVAELLDRRRDVRGALASLERARLLPPRPSVQATEALLSMPSLESGIPHDAVVIEYAVLATRLVIFVVDRTGIEVVEHDIGERDVSALVERFSKALEEGEEESLSKQLYSLLIPKGLSGRREETILYLIPDKVLHKVPFAALRNPATSRYLVQDHPVALLSSLARALRSNRSSSRVVGLKALLVQDPTVDHARFPELERLTQGAVEVAEALRIFPQATVLREAAATKTRILEALNTHQVLIFSGHAVMNGARPSESYLVVASEEGDESAGVLMGRELAGRDLGNLRLVVLSSCETIGPRNARVSGLAGMARFFLDAGAETIVGSLWRVEDREAAMVLRDFWSRIGAGAPAVKALQEAQLHHLPAMRSRGWAAFSLIVRGLKLQG
jgi:CHAT domain-containing protein